MVTYLRCEEQAAPKNHDRFTVAMEAAGFTEISGCMCQTADPSGGLTRGPAAARVLGLWVWNPPEASIFDSCVCCVLSGKERSLRRVDRSSRGVPPNVVCPVSVITKPLTRHRVEVSRGRGEGSCIRLHCTTPKKTYIYIQCCENLTPEWGE
jgi:hypothetical protein